MLRCDSCPSLNEKGSRFSFDTADSNLKCNSVMRRECLFHEYLVGRFDAEAFSSQRIRGSGHSCSRRHHAAKIIWLRNVVAELFNDEKAEPADQLLSGYQRCLGGHCPASL